MTIQRAEVDSVVAELFRNRRRQWRGQGGGGNPHETWSDLQGLVSLAFLLDPDAVFTVALWSSGQLAASLSSLQEVVDELDGAAAELSGDLPTLEDTEGLDKASSALSQALRALDRGTVKTALPKIEAARTKVEAFVRESLVPVVSVGGLDRKTPQEARSVLREGLPTLNDRLGVVLDAADVLRDLLGNYEVVLPPSSVRSIIRRVRTDVDALRSRMADQTPSDRLTQAREDLIRLLADCATIEQLGSFQAPVLVKTMVACQGYGSGDGPNLTGTISEPYELVDGVSDQLKLGFDGVATVQYDMVDSPNEVILDFPIAPAVGDRYTVPVPGPYQMRFLVDGREGAPVPIAAGMWTAAAVVAAVAATPGAIPENPVASPMLDVAEEVFLGSTTVRVKYNVGGCVPANAGLGCYVEIRGDAALMNAFGWYGTDAGSTTTRTARAYWKPVPMHTVIEFLGRQMYGADRIGDVAKLTPLVDIVASGNRGSIFTFFPTTFRVINYQGTGTWYAATNRLVLSGDELLRVKRGDRVVFTGVAATFSVASKRPDGVVLSVLTGAFPVTGSYVATIAPPQGTVLPGMTLTYWDRGTPVPARILSAVYDAVGRLLLTLDRRPSLLPYTPIEGITYVIQKGVLVLSSANNGPAGSTEVEGVASDAAPFLGLAAASAPSQVDQVYGATADFSAADVRVDDYVYTGGTPSIGHGGSHTYTGGSLLAVVAEILSSQVLRIDRQITGTTSTDMSFLHRQYQLYNVMVATFTALDTMPTAEDLEPLVLECLRAPETMGTALELQTQLGLITSAVSTVLAAIATFRSDFGNESDVITDCREALEESGADRAVHLLTTGRLEDLFTATTDEATYGRRLLRSMRAVSRTMLGSSVFSQAIRQEVSALSPREELELGVDVLPQEEMGPPRMNRR